MGGLAVEGSWLEDTVGRTRDAGRAAVEDMGVDHRGAHVIVAQELLNGPDIASIFEEVRGERVAERRQRSRPPSASRQAGHTSHALHHGLMQMVAAALTGGPVEVVPRSGEDPLPGPLAAGVRVLAGQGPGPLDPAGAASQVGLVLALHALEMVTERPRGDGRENGHAILGAFPVTDAGAR